MKTVKVNGVKPTEDQIRAAVAELDTPTIANLTRVRRRDQSFPDEGVVITGFVQQRYIKTMSWSGYKFTVVGSTGVGTSYVSAKTLLDVWEPI